MDKVYKGCMLVDERELSILLSAIANQLTKFTGFCGEFNELTRLYVKLLDEKESIQREREKHEPKTESV